MAQFKRFWPLLLLILAAAMVYALGLHRLVGFDTIVTRHAMLEAVIAARPVTSALAFAAIYIVAVGLSIPGAVFLTLGGGLLFGWKVAAPLTVIAATIGACIIFLVAKTSLGGMLLSKQGGAMLRLRQGFSQGAASYLLFLRLVPVFPFALVNLAAAALGAPFRTFAWTTLLGIIPATTAFSIAGSGLGSVVSAQAAAIASCQARGGTDCRAAFDAAAILSPELLAAFAALGCVALIPVIVKAVYARRGQSSQAGP